MSTSLWFIWKLGKHKQVFVSHRQMRLPPNFFNFHKSFYSSITMGVSVCVTDDGFFSAKLLTFPVYTDLSPPWENATLQKTTTFRSCLDELAVTIGERGPCFSHTLEPSGITVRAGTQTNLGILLVQVLVAMPTVQYRCWHAQGCPKGSQ